MIRKQYVLLVLVMGVSAASCTSQQKNKSNVYFENRNYLEGSQAEIDRNVRELEKKREENEKKIEFTDYEVNKPK